MGQKIHPGGLRVGVIHDWKSNWYTGKKEFADYIRRVDVPGSKYAFGLQGKQMRYLAVKPERQAPIKEIELVKGPDETAPVVMAVTVEAQ